MQFDTFLEPMLRLRPRDFYCLVQYSSNQPTGNQAG